MGKVQCVSVNHRRESFQFIEKYLNNINTPLERKMHDEYYHLKNQMKGKLDEHSSLNARKKMEHFIKWYQMVQYENSYNSVGSLSERSSKCVTPVKGNNSLQASYNSVNAISKFDCYDSNPTISRINGKHLDNISHILHTESAFHSEVGESSQRNSDISSIDLDSHSISLSPTLKSNQIERNLKRYYQYHRQKFTERVIKGPPESLRWVTWLISGNVPEDREEETFLHFFNEKIDEKVDNQIKKDLNRTLSDLCSFNVEEAQSFLYRILRAFSNNDKEVSYCQGMNFIVGFLLVLSDFNEVEAFYMMIALFSETFGDNLGIRGFFSEGFPLLKAYLYIFDHFFAKKMPELRTHFEKLEIPEEIWIAKWFQTLYTICLPPEVLVRLWDGIMGYGLDFMISFSLALIKQFETDMLKFTDAFDVIEYFKNMGSIISGSSLKIHIDIEEIISQALKLKISRSELNAVKREYETKFKVDLSVLKVRYEIASIGTSSRQSKEGSFASNTSKFELNPSKISTKSLTHIDITKARADGPSKKSTCTESDVSTFDKTEKTNFFGETFSNYKTGIIKEAEDYCNIDDTLDGDVSNTIDSKVNNHKFNVRRVSIRGCDNFNEA